MSYFNTTLWNSFECIFLQQRLLLAILDACGYIFIESSLNKLERKINKNEILHDKFKQRSTHLLAVLKASLPFLIHFHHAIFYWNGTYYNIVKRILGIRYVSTLLIPFSVLSCLAFRWLKKWFTGFGKTMALQRS